MEKKDLLLTDDQRKTIAQDAEANDAIYSLFMNDGTLFAEGGARRFSVKDLLTLPDVTRFIPQVVTRILYEAREPQLLITGIFDRIRLERGQYIQIGAIGAIQVYEVPENGEYKPADIDFDSGNMVGLSVRKYGILLQFTEEMFDESQWDIIGVWLKAAGRAFARNREQRAAQLLTEQGAVVFDNVTPSGSQIGVTQGRNILGAANGSMNANDLFDMYAFLAMRGFTPNVIIMHPLAWAIFASDPEMREVALQNGTLVSRRMPEGSMDPGWETELKRLGLRTAGTGLGLGSSDPNAPIQKIGSNPYTSNLSPLGATFHVTPTFLPSPLNILVSPFVPFNTQATAGAVRVSTTSIIMLDSNAVGAFIEKTPLSSEEINDPLRDTRALKLRERWGMVLYEQGKGVAIAKNIVVARNYSFNVAATITTFAEIPSGTAIVT